MDFVDALLFAPAEERHCRDILTLDRCGFLPSPETVDSR
jgi:predicted nucleic acid-binding protein